MQVREIQKHIIHRDAPMRELLIKLNELRADAVLFVVDDKSRLLGTLTDGDLRRGFIKGYSFETPIFDFVQPDPLFVHQDRVQTLDISDLRARNFLLIPVVDDDMVIVKILNLRITYSNIPVDVVIMAGGRGQRLMPLTKDTPKPMLHVGDKPILEHQINHLIKYGVKNIYISVNYLAERIIDHFGDGSEWGVSIKYLHESKPLGTLGSVKLANSLKHDHLLIMNSDILTNIDYAGFFNSFTSSDADMAIASSSYYVNVPYGVLEVDNNNRINSIREKPSYTYYSNAGIYFAKKELLSLIPDDEPYNVTDLIQYLLDNDKKLISYPLMGYWLDIGRVEDYKKAQEDIKYITV